MGALLTAGGAALAALTANHSVIGAATFATLGGVGHLCFYGLDMRVRRVTVTPVDGLDVASIADQLEQAHLRLRRIDAAANAIAVPEFRSRLARITAAGRDILAEIARDPGKASRARRFLNLFLDSTERVTAEYARTHSGIRSRPLEENFRKLLLDMRPLIATVVWACLATALYAQAPTEKGRLGLSLAEITKPWTGDLDGMLGARGILRGSPLRTGSNGT